MTGAWSGLSDTNGGRTVIPLQREFRAAVFQLARFFDLAVDTARFHSTRGQTPGGPKLKAKSYVRKRPPLRQNLG